METNKYPDNTKLPQVQTKDVWTSLHFTCPAIKKVVVDQQPIAFLFSISKRISSILKITSLSRTCSRTNFYKKWQNDLRIKTSFCLRPSAKLVDCPRWTSRVSGCRHLWIPETKRECKCKNNKLGSRRQPCINVALLLNWNLSIKLDSCHQTKHIQAPNYSETCDTQLGAWRRNSFSILCLEFLT